MEIKADALVLRTADYGENDKMVTLFTADRGKIGAAMKGVKKAGAKLRFAAQPFCFAEYVLAEKNGRYTVTSAALYDGFYSIREDIRTYYAAAAVCEACDGLLYEGIVNNMLFVAAVKALGKMSAGEPDRALVEFMLTTLRCAGYPVGAGNCPACGGRIGAGLTFDFQSGEFFCGNCRIGSPASYKTYELIRSALAGKFEETETDAYRRSLRLLKTFFEYQTENSLPSLTEYIRMSGEE